MAFMEVADKFVEFDLLKPKERHGPHFHTREVNSMLILTMQLKGYIRKNIKVEINEDVSRIIISGEKPVQDMSRVRGKVVKKDIETRGFQKAFKLPRGVVMDKLVARFNEEDSELIIQMPTIGVIGVGDEEFKIKEIKAESTIGLQVHTDGELLEQDNQEEEHKQHKEKQEQVRTNNNEDDSQEPKSPQKSFKICTPVIFGSAFFMSLIVLVFHLVRSEKPMEKKGKKTRVVCS